LFEKTYTYGRPWFGIAFGVFLAVLFVYVLIVLGTKDVVGVVVMGFMILMALAFAAIMFASLGRKVIINEEGITYEEPLAKNIRGQKKKIKSRWQDVVEVKECLGYLGHDTIVKAVSGTFRVTSAIKGYRDLMTEIRRNVPHLRQAPGSKLLHLVSKTELERVRKRKLPLKIKIWIGVISAMIIWAYVVVARNWYDFFMISLAWFYVIYLVQTKK